MEFIIVENTNDFITTTEACDLLKVSKTVIKRMADDGSLDTWKTPGGHRRLRRSSVERVLAEKNGMVVPSAVATQDIKILVIDDDPVMTQVFSSLINKLDMQCELVMANDGYEGLLKAGQDNYDVIFVDLQMPKLDGYAAVNALKTNEKNKSATIMVITASELQDVDRSRLPDDISVLTKPLNFEVLNQFFRYENRLKNQ